jgi:hypothetical protein
MQPFDGPIPGENFTSDTKNYPWHRPPEYTDLDEAIEYIGTRLTNEDSSVGLISMMEMGIPVVDLTQMFLMSGVGAGKWTLDFALMLAGPVAHIISLMGQSFGVKYELGLEDKANRPPSRGVFEMVHEINRAKAAAAGRRAFDSVDDIAADTDVLFKDGVMEQSPPPKFRGFMGAQAPTSSPASSAEQEEMLGQDMEQEAMMGAGV